MGGVGTRSTLASSAQGLDSWRESSGTGLPTPSPLGAPGSSRPGAEGPGPLSVGPSQSEGQGPLLPSSLFPPSHPTPTGGPRTPRAPLIPPSCQASVGQGWPQRGAQHWNPGTLIL